MDIIMLSVLAALGIGFLCSIAAIILSFIALLKILALEKSTHKVEWRTIGDKDVSTPEELSKALYNEDTDPDNTFSDFV